MTNLERVLMHLECDMYPFYKRSDKLRINSNNHLTYCGTEIGFVRYPSTDSDDNSIYLLLDMYGRKHCKNYTGLIKSLVKATINTNILILFTDTYDLGFGNDIRTLYSDKHMVRAGRLALNSKAVVGAEIVEGERHDEPRSFMWLYTFAQFSEHDIVTAVDVLTRYLAVGGYQISFRIYSMLEYTAADLKILCSDREGLEDIVAIHYLSFRPSACKEPEYIQITNDLFIGSYRNKHNRKIIYRIYDYVDKVMQNYLQNKEMTNDTNETR